MPENSIKERCHINTNWDTDTFVGIKCDDGKFSINFPLGFHISNDEKGLRRDILLMLTVLSEMVDKKDSVIMKDATKLNIQGFPVQAYLFLIADYYNHGYYKEREIQYQVNSRGKINWGRTIKTQRPYIQDLDTFYLKFVTRNNPINENEIITLIHEFCVYESFCKLGWLFTSSLPQKPRIKFNKKYFKVVLKEKYSKTFNDRNKELFMNMIAVIDSMQNQDSPLMFEYGIDPFDYVWELMIDTVYGIRGKELYYPNTSWSICGTDSDNRELRPDSIMIYNGNVFVLDAKNYKYGHTKKLGDLPKSTDINKQITYGEYIDEQKKFRKMHGNDFVTYNAFLMPFDKHEWHTEKTVLRIGEATGNWKTGDKTYERIQGVLIDVKFLMNQVVHPVKDTIEKLGNCIETALKNR